MRQLTLGLALAILCSLTGVAQAVFIDFESLASDASTGFFLAGRG